MLPVQDVMPSRTTPWVTLGLMAVITATLIVELALSEHSVRGLIVAYGLVPAHASLTTLVTSAFLHYGVFDASLNLLALWIFGDNLEDRLGRSRYLALFLVSVVLSGLAASGVSQAALTPIIGAAGGVGAVVGAHLVLMRSSRVLVLVPIWRGIDLVEIPSTVVVLAWVLLTSLTAGVQTGLSAGVPLASTVQVSGLLVGAVLARLLARPERLRCSWWNVPATHSGDLRRTSRETSARSASSTSN